MLTETDLQETKTRETEAEQAFHKGVVDFVKWTTTLAAAALLWVGTTTTSDTGLPRTLALCGLLSLITSLVLAILAINQVLRAWASEWNVAREQRTYILVKRLKALDPDRVTEEQEEERIQRYIQAIDATRSYRQPKAFYAWVIMHVIFLTAGLLLYAVAQVISST